MIKQLVNLEAVDKQGRNPLSRAAAFGSEQGAKALVKSGVRVDAGDDDRSTTLQLTAFSRFERAILQMQKKERGEPQLCTGTICRYLHTRWRWQRCFGTICRDFQTSRIALQCFVNCCCFVSQRVLLYSKSHLLPSLHNPRNSCQDSRQTPDMVMPKWRDS